jgi:hypothetical protein
MDSEVDQQACTAAYLTAFCINEKAVACQCAHVLARIAKG